MLTRPAFDDDRRAIEPYQHHRPSRGGISRITRAGAPITTTLEGTSCVTTLLAPITEKAPIRSDVSRGVTTTVPAPMTTFCSIVNRAGEPTAAVTAKVT